MSPHALKKRKLNHSSEVNDLVLDSNSTYVYDGNIFKLQLDELLEEVKPMYKNRIVRVEKTLRKIKGIVESIPSRAATPVSFPLE